MGLSSASERFNLALNLMMNGIMDVVTIPTTRSVGKIEFVIALHLDLPLQLQAITLLWQMPFQSCLEGSSNIDVSPHKKACNYQEFRCK